MNAPDHNRTDEDEDRPAVRRIQRLSLHISPASPSLASGVGGDGTASTLRLLPCAARAPKLTVSTQLLSEYMKGKYRDVQERVFEYFNSRPDLQTPVEISTAEHRELCMRQFYGLVREAGIRPFKYIVDDPMKYFAIGEAAGSVDMSLGIKMGVQYR